MNAKPKVTITYADHLDLEESVMNVSSTCKEIVTPNGGHGDDLGGLNADSSSSPLQRVIQLSYIIQYLDSFLKFRYSEKATKI